MENQILEAIIHIRKISKKKIKIDRNVAQIDNSAATNWDLESIKLFLNEMTAKVIINESYKPLTIFVTDDASSQNDEQTNLAETTTPPSRLILTPRKSEGPKLYEFTELKKLLMAEICDLKTNYAPDSKSNSKKGNAFHKDQLIRRQS